MRIMIQIRLDPVFFDRKFENVMLQRIFLYIVDQALFRMFLTITEHYVNEISRPNDCRVEKVQIEVLHILRNRKYIFLSCIKMSSFQLSK